MLDHAARDDEVRDMTGSSAAVERLWDVCQIPDYRKIAPADPCRAGHHALRLSDARGRIPNDWFAQVELADRADGDIDTLSGRIAHIRTWTFGPTGRTGWPIPNIGRASRAESKINCPMRCTNGSRSVSLIAEPVY